MDLIAPICFCVFESRDVQPVISVAALLTVLQDISGMMLVVLVLLWTGLFSSLPVGATCVSAFPSIVALKDT